MTHGRILAVHDISCVGRCSLTVALPIISSLGIECSVLPTAVLSTHTGGFKGFTYRDLTEDITPVMDHWNSLGLRFQAFYTGFLGSFEQIDLVQKLVDRMSENGTKVYIDPVMGDNGALYSVFDMDFPKGMKNLCMKADVLMPNLTELCFMLGMEYRPGPYTWDYIESVFRAAEVFGLEKIVITGISFEEGKVGTVYKDYRTGETGSVMRDQIEGYYHGTGDVFGSALVGCLESGLSLKDSVVQAVDFTVGSIIRTHDSGADVRYGVDFEQGLRELADKVDAIVKGISFESVTTPEGVSRVAGLAAQIWREAYADIVSSDQIGYMLDRFQSFKPISEFIEDGGLYFIFKNGIRDIGYMGACPEQDRMFLSKIYIANGYRGLGFSHAAIDFLKDISLRNGLHTIYLTVKRDNEKAVRTYQSLGFVVKESIDKPIGDGFEMNDYVMELSF